MVMTPAHHEISIDASCTRIHGFTTAASVSNFLGIPFGRVKKRFCVAERVPLSSLGPSISATKWGPRCPQSRNHGREGRGYLYEGNPASSEVSDSETDCLNLNIFAPEDALISNAELPVMVWIHGGGWVFGDGGPDYDGNSLVSEAARLKKPFILVTLNYRLGYYGFLSSQELELEAAAENQKYIPNLGLHDQRLALEWVQQNIGYFGGNAAKVTVAGQSAGAWSALSHLVAKVPLCHRGIIMSATVIDFETAGERQSAFDGLVRRAGVSATASPTEKLQALRSMSDEQMTDWLDGAVLIRPTWDPVWFQNLELDSRLDQITSVPEWVDGVMIGSTKDETAAIGPVWERHSADTIREVVTSLIPDPELANEIMQVYGVDSSAQEDVVRGLIELTTESFFALFPPLLGDMRAPVIVYRFDQTDSFKQSLCKDRAYHCLDLPFLSRVPAVAGIDADASLRATSGALTSAIADFVSGELPWEPYHVSHTSMVFDGEKSGLQSMQDTERWRQFFDTPARGKILVDTGRALMTYKSEKLTKQT